MGTTLQEDLKTYALVFLKSTVFVFLQNLPSPPSFTTLSIRAEFLGRREAAGRDSLNQSRPHKRNFLKL